MTSFTRIHALLLNPVVITVFTSSLGLGSATLTLPSTPTAQAVEAAPSVSVGADNRAAEIPEWLRPSPIAAPSKAEAELARRFSDALSGKTSKPTTTTTLKPKAAQPIERVWVCGVWEELVQGRGHGRTCEWR